ncbi:DUF6461 domain-containing protein [Gordonia humi]|uniref:DUF6461 domain-containing protein n=1 Tax=Gordonia humi TaxID=686429 RepID=UPI00361A39D8
MSYTYRDFEWIEERYPWLGVAYCITLVTDCESTELLDALTGHDLSSVTGLSAVNEQSWDYQDCVGTAACGTAALAIAPNNTAGSTKRILSSLSTGRTAVTLHRNVNAVSRVCIWTDSTEIADFDPLLGESALIEDRTVWATLMREAGLDPEQEGPPT